MGTRALISINGKAMIATHWDGYPSALGSEFLQCDKTLGAIIRVAEGHTIDGADSSIREGLNRKRLKELSGKHRLSEKEIRNGKRLGPLITADDYEICDLNHYQDWAEYQYDIRGKEVFFRQLRGQYPESLENTPGFERLTREVVENEIEG